MIRRWRSTYRQISTDTGKRVFEEESEKEGECKGKRRRSLSRTLEKLLFQLFPLLSTSFSSFLVIHTKSSFSALRMSLILSLPLLLRLKISYCSFFTFLLSPFSYFVPFLLFYRGDVTSLAFLSDGRALLSGSRDHDLKLWDIGTGSEIRSIPGKPKEKHTTFSLYAHFFPSFFPFG